MTAPLAPLGATEPYFRRPLPIFPANATASDVADGLTKYLRVELLNVQRAIPVANTKKVFGAYSIMSPDDVVLVDATSGAITILFPDPTRAQNGTWTVKKIDSSGHAVTLKAILTATGGLASFDGSTAPTLSSQYASATYRSDGVQYWRIATV
jgi:hypothetical protein